MKNTNGTIEAEKVSFEKVGFVKREKIVCPLCGKKIWSDSVFYHNKAEHSL